MISLVDPSIYLPYRIAVLPFARDIVATIYCGVEWPRGLIDQSAAVALETSAVLECYT